MAHSDPNLRESMIEEYQRDTLVPNIIEYRSMGKTPHIHERISRTKMMTRYKKLMNGINILRILEFYQWIPDLVEEPTHVSIPLRDYEMKLRRVLEYLALYSDDFKDRPGWDEEKLVASMRAYNKYLNKIFKLFYIKGKIMTGETNTFTLICRWYQTDTGILKLI